jgi:hypothetical protein
MWRSPNGKGSQAAEPSAAGTFFVAVLVLPAPGESEDFEGEESEDVEEDESEDELPDPSLDAEPLPEPGCEAEWDPEPLRESLRESLL